MKYAKGTIFEAYDENYVVVGKLHTGLAVESYVLAAQDDESTEVLVYTEDEVEEGIEAGWLSLKR